MEKKNIKFSVRVGVLAIPFVFVSYGIYAVVLADLIAAFPDVAATTVQMVLSIPAMAAVAGIYIPSFLNYWLSRKRMAQIALLMQFAAGMLMLVFGDKSIWIMLGGCAVLGLCYGILATCANLIINTIFDGKDRTTMMGLYSAANNTGKPIYAMIAGVIALISWKAISILHIINGISFLLVTFLVPADKSFRAQGLENGRSENTKSRIVINSKILIMFFSALMYGIFAFVRSSQSSLYVVGYKLGNSATTGTLTSLTLVIALPVAIFFGLFYKIFKEKIMFVGWLIMGVTYIFCGQYVSLFSLYVGTVGGNIIQNIIFPLCGLVASMSVPEEARPASTSFVVSSISIGVFLSPIIVNGLAKIFGNTTPAGIWTLAGFVGIGMAAFMFVFSKAFRGLDKPISKVSEISEEN